MTYKIDLSKDWQGRWHWTVTDGKSGPGTEEYRTDQSGEGLWWYGFEPGRSGKAWVQTLGTGQFSLSQDYRKALAYLRAFFKPPASFPEEGYQEAPMT